MKQVTTYVGIDAHKKDLFIAMLVGDHTTPVTWQLATESNAVRRLVRKLEREAPGGRARLLRGWAVRLRFAAPDIDTPGELSGNRPRADPSEAR